MAEASSVLSRRFDSPVVADFLTGAAERPCALLVEGEAGIGKTTFCLAVLDRAAERGFRVLSARPAAAETVLAYASLADLLSGVDPAMWANLPEPQRLAIDRITLQAAAGDRATDHRAVAAGFLSVVEELASQTHVLLAIDDLQWLDASSAAVLSFAARRLTGPVGVLGAVRLESDTDVARWLRMPRPDALKRIRLPPMGLGELQHVLSQRLGRSFARPVLVRIHDISGGNPFYAIELGRAIVSETIRVDTPLPGTLAELVRARLGALGTDLQEVLLAAACNAAPTVELLALALDTDQDRLGRLLDEARDKGIVVVEGNRIRFSHPLLAHGVYTGASASRRREMHQRMAGIVDEPEVRARHLALASVKGEPTTLQALDDAAEMARVRGAPTDAAELIELAVGLGGDTPRRRMSLAACRFNSGDGSGARAELEAVVSGDGPPLLRAEALTMLGMISQLEGTLTNAASELSRALAEAGDDLELRARILMSLSWVQIHNFDQHAAAARSIEDAVTAAEQLGRPEALSEALGMHAVVHLLLGNGLNHHILRRATELEVGTSALSVMFRPTVESALALAWSGQLDAAHEQFVAIRQNCIERGEESELVFVSFHAVHNEIWRADLPSAALVAEDTAERARHLEAPMHLAAALSVRAMAGAYAGNEDDVRRDTEAAIGTISSFGSQLLQAWAVAPLGFLEVSLGNYQAAVHVLEPLLGRITAAPNAAEIFAAGFVPDAVEALIQLGRLDDAEPLIDFLERNGYRLDRPWLLAVGARGRGMLLAARGDLDSANMTVQRAMAEHDRLPMPFERERTRLLLGQIQRRQRQKDIAASTLGDALSAFDAMGTPLWADRARAELQRVKVGPQQSAMLTASEERVAELAASGMTNREIAGALFISPKTVESNMARVYRKLGIHRRAELGRHFGHAHITDGVPNHA